VTAGELKIWEHLQAKDGGTPRVLSFVKREEPERVINLEVEGDHCYRVGEQGLLVHNESAPAHTGDCSKISSFSNDPSTPMMLGGSPVGHGIPLYRAKGPTRGVLLTAAQQARLVSGEGDPGQWLLQGVVGGPGSGLTTGVPSHVEGHAVSIMIQCCIQDATLYVNRKPCDGPPANCQVAIGRLLPKGWIINVVYESMDGTMALKGRFVGGIGWEDS
jgi:hypothetical protein